EIYQELVVADISNAADVFRGVYTETGGIDGYCSLEVSPNLAFETQKTIDEAKKLFAALNRPNVMVKIPATPQGIPAIEECIADAKLAYQSYQHIFHGERFAKMRAKGARPQRQLWASTGTKNPKYSDVLYVEQLIGPETVDTVPPATFNAFRDHGKVELTLEK